MGNTKKISRKFARQAKVVERKHIRHELDELTSHHLPHQKRNEAPQTPFEISSLLWILLGVSCVTLGIIMGESSQMMESTASVYLLRALPIVIALMSFEAGQGIKRRRSWGRTWAYISALVGAVSCAIAGGVLYYAGMQSLLLLMTLWVAAPIAISMYEAASAWMAPPLQQRQA